MKDKNGKILAAWINPKTKKAVRWVADPENAEYRAWYVDEIVAWLKLDVDALQRDEPSGWGRARYDRAKIAEFFNGVHAEAFERAGRKVAISCNLGWNQGRFGGGGKAITDCYDAGMSEYYERGDSPGFVAGAADSARRERKALCFTGGSNLSLHQNRRAIAACYANGLRFLVPWDQFTGKDKPRYFAKPEELADLYGFVRANAMLLDGYEHAGAMWPAMARERAANQAGIKIEGEPARCARLSERGPATRKPRWSYIWSNGPTRARRPPSPYRRHAASATWR